MAGESQSLGPFVFDTGSGTLTRDGHPVPLGVRASALLGALLSAGGSAIGKDALMEAAWPGTVVEEANLTVQIAKIRKLLGNRPDGTEWIVTVPRFGYRMPTCAALTGQEARSRRPSIAVLPFTNLSSDPEQDYFADGVVEDLITALSRFKAFAVVARNSTFVYKGRAVDVRDVAKELGVRYVLEGSVRRAGDRIRVSAQLIEGETGAHLWAQNFDGTFANFFDFQDEITTSVVGLIEPELRKAEIERARLKRPENRDAWDLYIQALPIVCAAKVAGYDDAIALLDRAIALDPSYAPALALAAWAHEKRTTYLGKAPPGVDDKAEAMALAERALKIDPDDAFALALLGWMRILFNRDYAGLGQLERALALNPNNRLVLQFAGTTYLFAGDLNDVITWSSRSLQLSPGDPDAYMSITHIAQAYLDMGRFEEAATWAQRSIDTNAEYLFGYLTLACAYVHLGRVDEARAVMATVLAITPSLAVGHATKWPQRFPERRAIWIEGLRRAGLPE